MTNDQIAFLVVASIVYFGWGLLLLRRPDPVEAGTGDVSIQHGWLLRGLAIFCAIIPAAIVVLGFLTDAKGADAYAVLGLLLGMSILITPLLLEVLMVRLLISDDGVQLDSPWRRRRFFRWKEIADVRYSPLNHWFILIHEDGRKLRASTYLSGIVALVRAFSLHLPKVRYENAYQGIELVEKAEPFHNPPRRRGGPIN